MEFALSWSLWYDTAKVKMREHEEEGGRERDLGCLVGSILISLQRYTVTRIMTSGHPFLPAEQSILTNV